MQNTTTVVTDEWTCDQDTSVTATTTRTDPNTAVVPDGWAIVSIMPQGLQPVYAVLCPAHFAPYLAAVQAFLAANPTGV